MIESEVREASSLWEIRQELEKPVNNESETNEEIEYKHVENQTLEIAKFQVVHLNTIVNDRNVIIMKFAILNFRHRFD